MVFVFFFTSVCKSNQSSPFNFKVHENDECVTFQRNNMIGEPSVVSISPQRLRRWPNIETTMGERLVFAGYNYPYPADLIYLNFQALEVVSGYRDPQPQVLENYSHLYNLRRTFANFDV